MALAEEHERANRITEALAALEAAAQARAPAEKVVPALVRVSRLLGDTRRLLVALRRSKKLTRDEAARRAIDAEIGALVTDLVYDGPQAAGPSAAKRSKKRPPRAAQIAAPHHEADPAASSDDKREPEPPKPEAKEPEPQRDALTWMLLIALVSVGAVAALLRLLG